MITSSDSQPLQFWDIDDDTFNETSVCGLIKQDCFCAPFQCTDLIVFQFLSNIKLGMRVLSEASVVLHFVNLTEVSSGTWQNAIVPSDISAFNCNQKIQFMLMAYHINNGLFTAGALAPWTNVGSGNAWTAAIGYATATVAGVATSKTLTQVDAIFKAGTAYTFTITLVVTGNTGNIKVNLTGGVNTLWIFNGAGAPGENPGATGPEPYGVGTYTVIRTFTPTHDYDTMIAQWGGGGVGNPQVKITFAVSPDIYETMKSDCLDIKTSQECTELIAYTNSSDFDGIDYSLSPAFYLRVPAIFFDESNPQEQEDLELSNGVIVTIRQSIQEKKLLDVGFMPPYMIKKLQKILMTESIYIDGTYWKKRDSFDSSPIKKYNLKRSSVLLTKYNSVEKNTI